MFVVSPSVGVYSFGCEFCCCYCGIGKTFSSALH